MRIKNLFRYILITLFSALFTVLPVSLSYASEIEDMDYIVHAGGSIGNFAGTNSYEALPNF